MKKRLLVLGTPGGPTALASGVGTLGALEDLSSQFEVVGVSGISGWAAPAGAIALQLPYEKVLSVLLRADSHLILRPAVPNILRWASSLGRDFFTGFFRGLPIRALFRVVLGDRKFQSCRIPLEIPALSVEGGEVVYFTQTTTPDVEIARAARASSANPAFEAEAGFDRTGHHYVDPGLSLGLSARLLDQVDFDHCLILVNDITRAGPLKEFKTRNWSYPRLLYQVVADAYTANIREQVLGVLERTTSERKFCQVISAPGEVPFFEFTGRQLTQMAGATREKVRQSLLHRTTETL